MEREGTPPGGTTGPRRDGEVVDGQAVDRLGRVVAGDPSGDGCGSVARRAAEGAGRSVVEVPVDLPGPDVRLELSEGGCRRPAETAEPRRSAWWPAPGRPADRRRPRTSGARWRTGPLPTRPFESLGHEQAPGVEPEEPGRDLHYPQGSRRFVHRDEVRPVRGAEEHGLPALRARLHGGSVEGVGPTQAPSACQPPTSRRSLETTGRGVRNGGARTGRGGLVTDTAPVSAQTWEAAWRRRRPGSDSSRSSPGPSEPTAQAALHGSPRCAVI